MRKTQSRMPFIFTLITFSACSLFKPDQEVLPTVIFDAWIRNTIIEIGNADSTGRSIQGISYPRDIIFVQKGDFLVFKIIPPAEDKMPHLKKIEVYVGTISNDIRTPQHEKIIPPGNTETIIDSLRIPLVMPRSSERPLGTGPFGDFENGLYYFFAYFQFHGYRGSYSPGNITPIWLN